MKSVYAIVCYAVILALSCLINGCSTKKIYPHEIVGVPSEWPHAEKRPSLAEINLKKMNWWRQYHHPKLNDLMNRALEQNNDLKKSIANIEYAQKELTQIKLNWLPKADLLGGYSQFPIFANPGGFLMAAPFYVINIFQQYQQQQTARAQLEASVYAKDAAVIMVISQVATAYFTLIAGQETKILYQFWLQDMRTYYHLLQIQYRLGLIAQDDMTKIKSQIETIESQLVMVEHHIVVSQNTLHALLNENPGELSVHHSFKTLNTDAVIPANLPLNVIQNRPDVKQQAALLKAANSDIGAAIAALFPSMTVGAYIGTGTNSGPFSLLEAYPSLPIDLTLYAKIGMRRAQYQALCFNYMNTVKMALRDIDNAFSSYYQNTKRLKHVKLALKNEVLHCGWTKKRFEHGIVDQIELQRCQIKIDELSILVNQTKLEKMLSVIKLYQELAGGYDAK